MRYHGNRFKRSLQLLLFVFFFPVKLVKQNGSGENEKDCYEI